MITALAFVAMALGWVGWAVWRLGDAVERQASRVETHGEQLVKFGRAVYGSSGSFAAVGKATTADAEAAAKLASSSEARKSGPAGEGP